MTVAGFDPSGGAGVLSDIKTIAAFDCRGVAAVTTLTVQNSRLVAAAFHQTGEMVSMQMRLLFDEFDVAAVKTGVLPTRDIVEAVTDAIANRGCEVLVVDPVIQSTSGFQFMDDDALNALVTRLFPLASVVTPNASEAARITGVAITGPEGMARAGKALLDQGARAVLVKGGDLEGEDAVDILIDQAGETVLKRRRIISSDTHGTGCRFASAIACLLAGGVRLADAAATAKEYVANSMQYV